MGNITGNFHYSQVKSKVVENVLFSTNTKFFLQKSGKIFYTSIDMSLSGSPIIQNGNFIGAVTHVLVQDSAKGYKRNERHPK